jgi:ubiquinone/menaquinone biosynthesis C-methylase UbiE
MSNWFPSVYDTAMGPLERGGFKDIRKNLIGKARGDVLEIGSGTGINFPLYRNVEKVTAIEPNAKMRRQSVLRAQAARVPIEIFAASAEELPFAEHRFDTVVCTLVLCTIPDFIKALAEIRRICKPGGIVLFMEHVRLDHPVLGRLQDVLTPAWTHLCDGCHLNRELYGWIKQAGFEIVSMEQRYKRLLLVIEAINRK